MTGFTCADSVHVRHQRPKLPEAFKTSRAMKLATLALSAAMGLCLTVGSGDVLAQQFWKWRDANGALQISDRPPPPEVPESRIVQRPGNAARAPAPLTAPASAAAAAASAPGTDEELLARQKEAQASAEAEKARLKAEHDAKVAEVNAKNCQTARAQMAAINGGQRLVRMNDKGEREFLDEAQRARHTRETQAAVQKYCN